MAASVAPALQGARTRPPWSRQRAAFLALMALVCGAFAASWLGIHMGFFSLFTGIGNIVHFVGQNLPPQFVDFPRIANEALITLCIAVLGTAFSMVLAVPVGFAAASNTTPHRAVRWVARSVIVACRAVPDLVFAIIFVEALGVGVLPGVLALAFHSIGMLGKVFADNIEQVPPRQTEAVKSTGASRWQVMMTGIVPEVLPTFSSVALYRLDINLRSSVILGYVGAGGIGFLLNEYMGELQFRAAMGIVIVMFVLVVSMEVVAAVVRRSLIGLENQPVGAAVSARARGARRSSSASGRLGPWGGAASFDPRTLRPPWTRTRVQRFCFVAGALAVIVASFVVTKTTPWQAFESLGKIWHTVTLYFPPNFETEGTSLLTGALQSLAVAVIATLGGYFFALPIGLLAARNVSRPWEARTARLLLVVIRAVPELVIAIVFIVAVGLGLVAGALALTVGTVGFLAKLVADNIEEVSPAPREAVVSAGATKPQEIATSVLTPALPMLVGNGLYMLDINFRSVTILGIVGGGGIGYILWQSVNILAYKTTGAIIILTFVVVVVIEGLTNWVRKYLI